MSWSLARRMAAAAAVAAMSVAAITVSAPTSSAARVHPDDPEPVPTPDCPVLLTCSWDVAPYVQTGTSPRAYGDYDRADRPEDLRIRYIVTHASSKSWTEDLAEAHRPCSSARPT